jgi:magnesium-transporting ATPase (P-type)
MVLNFCLTCSGCCPFPHLLLACEVSEIGLLVFYCQLVLRICLIHGWLLSHLHRPWTTWTPLAIVLGVSMIKEAIEDYKRNKADNEINNRMVAVLNSQTHQFEQRRWKDLQPGEIVMVKRDEFFPADLLFLSSETEEGTCYVETMNLDGETNLKIKKAPDGN